MDPNLENLNQQPQQVPVQPAQPIMQTEQIPTPMGQQPVQPAQPAQPVQSQTYSTSQSEHHTGKSFLKVLLVLIIIIGATVGIVYAGYTFLGSKNTPITEPKNANVFVEPTQAVSPTPTGYQSNPADTSDGAIDKDTEATNTDLDNLDSAVTGVDQSLIDKQTNLQ